ncbi:MAG: tyrosine-type recombinase/integrase [Deltaproteobacteria bacterium]|nr:tyrosine-type recombinase/integrase [Deltaproteobacteria bacterium]
MSIPSRPKPFTIGGLSYGVVRGPNADGAWYWRARRADGTTAWTGWATRAEVVLQSGHIDPAPVTRVSTVADVLRRWLDARANDPQLARCTWIKYERMARGLISLIGQEPITTINYAVMDGVYSSLLRLGHTSKGATRHQQIMRAACARAAEQRLITPVLVPVTRARSSPKVNNDYTPTEREAAAVLRVTSGSTRLAIALLAVTGARVSEVMSLRRCAIDLKGGWLSLDGKTGPRRFPIPSELTPLLAPLAHGTQTLLFPWGMRRPEDRVYRALSAACLQLKQPEFTAHGLRRMVVNRLLRQGVDLKVAAELMGHSPEVMLTHYRRVSQEDKAAGVSKAGLGEALPVAAR